MLDYYGSIMIKKDEIDDIIINEFKKRANEIYIQNVIRNLRDNENLANEYSVSGWNMFFKDEIYAFINLKINHQLSKNKNKLKFIYCYNKSPYYNNDIAKLICDKI